MIETDKKQTELPKFPDDLWQQINSDGSVNIFVSGGTGYGYTIGLLENFQHPEIIIFGLGTDVTEIFLNSLRERIRAGESFETEKTYSDITLGFPTIFQNVKSDYHSEYTALGLEYYRRFQPELADNYQVYQMFWCDRSRMFPWNLNYGLDKSKQPMLF